MPLPEPTQDEERKDFISRCMADETMQKEFPQEQRLKVCERKFATSFTNESFSDYPKAAQENARRAISIKEETESDCGTQVGWERANQLDNGEALSMDTINRMVSFFARHEENKDGDPKEDCGALMWLAWGGDEAKRWAESKTNDDE